VGTNVLEELTPENGSSFGTTWHYKSTEKNKKILSLAPILMSILST
jgi:hypothetical protein